MPLSIKIANTKNKKEEENLDENEVEKQLPRIERKSVNELVDTVQIVSSQLDLILDEVMKRDKIVEDLEEYTNEQTMIIDSLTKDIEKYDNVVKNKDKEIEDLNCQINEFQNIITNYESTIKKLESTVKRLENEAQTRYEDLCKVKDNLQTALNEKEEMKKKLEVITGILKD